MKRYYLEARQDRGVKKGAFVAAIVPSGVGAWVLYDDAKAEIDALREKVDDLESRLEPCGEPDGCPHCCQPERNGSPWRAP